MSAEQQLMQSVTTFAKGCFLAGTMITTPDGDKAIETLSAGDEVISFNEKTGEHEVSVIGDIDVLQKDAYYNVNNEVNATGEHPFYTNKGIEELQYFDSTHKLIDFDGNEVPVLTYERVQESVTVYNLLDVVPNHNYYASNFLVHNKGCFLPDMRVVTPTGTKKIKDIRPQDTVISYNEKTHAEEYATVESVQIYNVRGYYVINDALKVTAEHPLYIAETADEWFNEQKSSIVEVQDIKIGTHLILGSDVIQEIRKIEYIDKKVKVYNLINVVPNHNYFVGDKLSKYLVHNKGGGGRGGGFGGSRSSASKSSSSTSKTTSKSTGKKGAPSAADKSANTSSSRSTTSSSTKAGSKVTTSDGKSVQTSSKKPTKNNVNQQAGITGVDGYTPRFTNGYSAPAGSVVYYPQHSFIDYLPWIYLFSQDSPAKDQATIVQPNGKEVAAQPVQEGVDGLAVFNWLLLIVMVIAVIGGIIYGVNRLTSNER